MSQLEDKRRFYVASTIVLSIAFAGLVFGTRKPVEVRRVFAEEPSAHAGAALSYKDMREGRRGPSSNMYDSAFSWLRSLGPALSDPVEQSEEDRALALERRRERRAYAGAPPVIPHPIQEREADACLACHRTGSLVAGLRAPMMSHQAYSMCVQCHAPTREAATMVLQLPSVGEENNFVGTQEAGPGERAWEGAPPTIPHPTFMREACNSCHGPLGAQGLRTPHPVQTSCTQCHAGSTSFDPRGSADQGEVFDQSAVPSLGGAPKDGALTKDAALTKDGALTKDAVLTKDAAP